MSRNINVNPGHYKVAGRERQGEDIIQRDQKQLYASQAGGGHHGEVPPWEATRHSFATAQPDPDRKAAKAPQKAKKAKKAKTPKKATKPAAARMARKKTKRAAKTTSRASSSRARSTRSTAKRRPAKRSAPKRRR